MSGLLLLIVQNWNLKKNICVIFCKINSSHSFTFIHAYFTASWLMDTLTNSSGLRYSVKGKCRSYFTCAIDNVLFVLILYVLVNIFFSHAQGQVSYSWTSTKQQIKCLAQGPGQHSDSVGSETRTSNPSIPTLDNALTTEPTLSIREKNRGPRFLATVLTGWFLFDSRKLILKTPEGLGW